MSKEQEPLIKEVTREEIDFINMKKQEYLEQGAKDLDAAAMAAEDWNKIQAASEEEGNALWDKLTKDVGMHDFIADQLIRALAAFKKVWHEKNPGQTLDFELKLYSDKGASGSLPGNRLIAAAGLRLSVSKNGVWTVWRDKKVAFQHIKEMREGYKWKLVLYEAMFQDIMAWGVNYMLMLKAVQDGDIKIPPKDGAVTE